MAYGFRTLCLFSPSSGAFTAYRKHKLRASFSDFPFAVRMPSQRTITSMHFQIIVLHLSNECTVTVVVIYRLCEALKFLVFAA